MDYKKFDSTDDINSNNPPKDTSNWLFLPSFLYNSHEWQTKIQEFLDGYLTTPNSLFNFFIYVYQAQTIEYDFLLQSNAYDTIISEFISFSFSVCQASKYLQNKKSQKCIQLSPKSKDISIVHLILILRRFFDTRFFIDHTPYNSKFIRSLTQLCFLKNVFYQIPQLFDSYRCLAIDALKITQKLAQFNQEIILQFDQHKHPSNHRYFSEKLWDQYVHGEFIELKLASIELFIPWLRIPGNQRTFEYFSKEIDKLINETNNTFIKIPSIQNLNKEKHKKIHVLNKFRLINVLMNGEYEFLIHEEDEFDSLRFAFESGIFNHVVYALETGYEPLKYVALQIVNRYFQLQKIPPEFAIEFVVGHLQERMPALITESERNCNQIFSILKSLSELECIYTMVFTEPFFHSFHFVLEEKESKWKMELIAFICFILMNIPIQNAAILFEFVNIAELIGLLGNCVDVNIVHEMLDGIIRLIDGNNEYQEILISQGLIDELESFLDDDTYSEKVNIILQILQTSDVT